MFIENSGLFLQKLTKKTQKLNFSGIRTFTLLGKVHKKQAWANVFADNGAHVFFFFFAENGACILFK